VGVFWGAFAQREPERFAVEVGELVAMWKNGELHQRVSATYPLERAGEAIRHLADRRAAGRVVVTIDR
jgi:NADPH:quinone reductase